MLSEDSSRLTRSGAVVSMPLQAIDVQSGGYLGAADIVRFEDLYQRTNGIRPLTRGVVSFSAPGVL